MKTRSGIQDAGSESKSITGIFPDLGLYGLLSQRLGPDSPGSLFLESIVVERIGVLGLCLERACQVCLLADV